MEIHDYPAQFIVDMDIRRGDMLFDKRTVLQRQRARGMNLPSSCYGICIGKPYVAAAVMGEYR